MKIVFFYVTLINNFYLIPVLQTELARLRDSNAFLQARLDAASCVGQKDIQPLLTTGGIISHLYGGVHVIIDLILQNLSLPE